MYHGVCHVEPFSDGHDGTSFEMVFCCSHQQHGDCLQALIICQICFGWVTMGCLLVGGILRFHHLLKPVLQTLTLFSLLLSTVTLEQMTIKHSMYMQKVPFLCTERACVDFFWFWDSPYKKSYVEQSVASFTDQREYTRILGCTYEAIEIGHATSFHIMHMNCGA